MNAIRGMFIENQPEENQDNYINLLRAVGGLSGLFSDSDSPYLYYRSAERAFCKAFDAEDLSRKDSSYDAKKNDVGIGLKTFLYKEKSRAEKIAEFNSVSDKIRELQNDPEILLREIARFRNDRIDFAKNLYDLSEGIYHCVARSKLKFSIFECPLEKININKIKCDRSSFKKNVLVFNDDINEYRFSLSKSTLFKRFDISNNIIRDIDIEILSDPFGLIIELYRDRKKSEPSVKEEIILPLYSERKGDVPERSGLNQWNAKGRARNEDEVYIQIPVWISKKFVGFFPPRSDTFNLKLPNGSCLEVCQCQDGGKINGLEIGKALMSNPNKALGDWLLRKVLKLKRGELCTLDKLKEIGIDSVKITKFKEPDSEEFSYSIDFMSWGSYEIFKDILKS